MTIQEEVAMLVKQLETAQLNERTAQFDLGSKKINLEVEKAKAERYLREEKEKKTEGAIKSALYLDKDVIRLEQEMLVLQQNHESARDQVEVERLRIKLFMFLLEHEQHHH